MFNENLIQLRKLNRMSQEQLAEKLGVSRQTVSKWETGESSPDILLCRRIADLFDVSLDALVSFETEMPLSVPPRGKHMFGCVKVGEKGQIVIPAQARKVFGIRSGDSLVVLGDEAQGIALMKSELFLEMADEIRRKMSE